MKSYIRFLRWKGMECVPLDAVSLNGPARRERTVPGRLSEEDFEALLASCDSGTVRGARDAAMALCMGMLGLSACDVASRHGQEDHLLLSLLFSTGARIEPCQYNG